MSVEGKIQILISIQILLCEPSAIELMTLMVTECCAVAVTSEAMDGAAPELNLDGFIDGKTAIAQYARLKYLQSALYVISEVKNSFYRIKKTPESTGVFFI